MTDVATVGTFPAGGAFLLSPADVGTPARHDHGGALSAEVKTPGPLDDADIQSAFHLMVTDAVQYVDQELSPARGLAADYYQGKPFGDEEEGRSQVVMTIVRDTVKRIMPSLMRVFFGGEKAVEFAPRKAEQVRAAEQLTEYISEVVIRADNGGLTLFYDWFKDALIKKLGIVTWMQDESEESTYYEQSALTADQVQDLDQNPEVTQLTVRPSAISHQFYDVDYVRVKQNSALRIFCIPPEEFLFTRGARAVKSDSALPGVAAFAGYRTQCTRSQLRGLGISEEDIDQWAFQDASLDHNVEEIARQAIVKPQVMDVGPEATRRALLVTGYPYLDCDGDGIAELRKIVALGPTFHIISNDPCDARPFAILCPDPEPHTIVGQSLADYTMDLQKIMSKIMRAILDSLALTVNPRVEYVEGEVALEDILNPELGAPIRATQPGMVREVVHTFVGKEGLGVYEKLEDVLENRTGVSKDTAGLDPGAMQSTTAVAVTAAVTAALQHIELIARIFAETGVTDLFKGLLRETVKHPPVARMVKLRGEYVPMDPEAWDSDLDVRVNVAIGGGLDAEKLDVLMGTIAKQEQIMQNLGPSNPIVSMQTYVRTLKKALKLRGRMDADEFFTEPPDNWQPPPPQPNPDQAKAQAEMMRAQADVQSKQEAAKAEQQRIQLEGQVHQSKAQLESQKIGAEDQRERAKIERELQLREYEIRLRAETDLEIARIQAAAKEKEAEADRQTRELEAQTEAKGHETDLEREKLRGEHDAKKMDHDTKKMAHDEKMSAHKEKMADHESKQRDHESKMADREDKKAKEPTR